MGSASVFMKVLVKILVIFLFSLCAFSQKQNEAKWLRSILDDQELSRTEYKDRIAKYNFSSLLTQSENSVVFGFLGDDYQRLRVKILTVTKQRGRPDTYSVTGKSMVKGVVRSFTGTMTMTKVRLYKAPHDGIDEENKDKRIKECGVVVGEYHFSENIKETETGKFDGAFATYWYVDDKGSINYDDHEMGADAYRNNQFVGTWTSFRKKVKKVANWGDYRIPLSGYLDIGAGEFSPDDTYLPNGWQSYRDAYVGNDKRALLEEERKWWN